MREHPSDWFARKTDADINVDELARVYVQDDETVTSTGKAMHNKMELVTRRAGGVEWRMTSKIPLYGKNSDLIGTAGVSRRLNQHEGHPLPAPYLAHAQADRARLQASPCRPTG